MTRNLWLVLIGIVLTTEASAITVDGTLDAGYGTAIAAQEVQTGFGDVLSTTVLGGSEIDATYAKIEDGRLYLMLTGNHEPNFNKLEIFFDSVAGGESQLSDVPQYDYFNGGAGNGFQWISRNLGGITFDTGFAADYHLYSRWGGGSPPDGPGAYEADFVNRQGGVNMSVPASSGITDPSVGLIASGIIPAGDIATYNDLSTASGTALTQNLEFAINDNNIAGVAGCDGGTNCNAANQAAALAVTTGMEFSIALADLGNPAPDSTIRIVAIVGNGDHNYLSNQSAAPFTAPQQNAGGNGSHPGSGTLAGDFTGTMVGMNFNNFAGTQFFSLTVPQEGTPGDYNGDTFVDAADYTVWRNNFGTSFDLSGNGNEAGSSAGTVDEDDYVWWKQYYGTGPGDGGGGGIATQTAVPEPASALIALVGVLVGGAMLRRRG